MRKWILALLVGSMAAACSSKDPLNSPGPVQFESPPPSAEGGQGPNTVDIDPSYKSIRVRVWPILSPPAGDPYPSTTNRSEVTLRGDSGIEVRKVNGQLIANQARLIEFNFQTQKMRIDGREQTTEQILVTSKNRNAGVVVEWKGQGVRQSYRGDFEVILTQNRGSSQANQWGIVNVVTLEDYLISVVPSEVPSSFELEAIKAQSLAARSYAVFHMGQARRARRNWDVDPTTAFQSYRGLSVEVRKITQAVVATISQVVTYQGSVVETFFSANSGGVTCLISECFRGTDRPYIVQKFDAAAVRSKPGGTYTATVTPQSIDREMRDLQNAGRLNLSTFLPGYKGPQDILQLEAAEVGPSGRVWRLAVRLKDGRLGTFSRSQSLSIRNGVGISSALYSLPQPNTQAQQTVRGHGFGHGVGMSQWGADALAEEGRSYQDIIGFYYPGTRIETLTFK